MPCAAAWTVPSAQTDFPVLQELAADGVTDYVALPLLFSDGSRQFVAFASDADGFHADQDPPIWNRCCRNCASASRLNMPASSPTRCWRSIWEPMPRRAC